MSNDTESLKVSYWCALGQLCDVHARYVEGVWQDLAILIERSCGDNDRNRNLSQQRDPKMKYRSESVLIKFLNNVTPDAQMLFQAVHDFSKIRNKYAHAYGCVDPNNQDSLVIRLLPHNKCFAENNEFICINDAISEIEQSLSTFGPVGGLLVRIHDFANHYSGRDTGFHFYMADVKSSK